MKKIRGLSAELANIKSSETSSSLFHFSSLLENVSTNHASCPGNQNMANTATMAMSMRTTLL